MRRWPLPAARQFLATVQVFITLLGIGTGAALGARIGGHRRGAAGAWTWPGCPPTATAPVGHGAVGVRASPFANMLTGQLLPKRMALVDPERIAIAVALPMRVLAIIANPFALRPDRRHAGHLRALRLNRASREAGERGDPSAGQQAPSRAAIDRDRRNMVNRVLRLGDHRRQPDDRRARCRLAGHRRPAGRQLRCRPRLRATRSSAAAKQDMVGVLEIRRHRRPGAPAGRPVSKPGQAAVRCRPRRALNLLEVPRFRFDPGHGGGQRRDRGPGHPQRRARCGPGKTPAHIEERHDAPIVQRNARDGNYLIDAVPSAPGPARAARHRPAAGRRNHDFAPPPHGDGALRAHSRHQ